MSPREILMESKQKKLKLISITDHNVLEGSKELSHISKWYNCLRLFQELK